MIINKSKSEKNSENKRDNWLKESIIVNPSSDTLLPNSQHISSRAIKIPTRSKQRFSHSIPLIKDEELPKIITDDLRKKILNNPKLAHLYVVRAQRECENNPSSEATRLCKKYEDLYVESKLLNSKIKQHNNKKSSIPDPLTH